MWTLATNTILIVLFIINCGSSAFGQEKWMSIGPSVAERVRVLKPDLQDSMRWYAIMNFNHLYTTSNGGTSWRASGIRQVFDVAQHPDTGEIFVLSQSASDLLLWKSSDHGRLFSRIRTIKNQWPIDGRIYFLPGRTDIFVLGFNNSLAVVTRNGKTYAFDNYPIDLYKVYRTIQGQNCYIDDFSFFEFAVSPFDPKTYFATSGVTYSCSYHNRDLFDPFLVVSNNEGRTWKILRRLSVANGYKLHSDPRLPNRLYVFGDDGLFVVSRNGLEKISRLQLTSIALIPTNPDEMFAVAHKTIKFQGSSSRLLHSVDAGHSWFTESNDFKHRIKEIFFSKDKSVSFANLWIEGLFHRFGDRAWEISMKGLPSVPIQEIENSAGSRLIYAKTEGWFYFTEDEGRTWKDFGPRLPVKDLSGASGELVAHPAKPKTIYYSTPGLFRSDDAGIHWKKLSSKNWRILAISPDPNEKLFIANENQAYTINRSSNVPVPVGPRFDYLAGLDVHPYDRSILIFYDGQEGQFISEDSGATIRRLPETPEAIVPLPNKDHYIVVRKDEIFLSTDALRSASKISKVKGLLRIMPSDFSGKRFVGIVRKMRNDFRLYESDDGGFHWKELAKLPASIDPAQSFTVTDISDGRYPFIYFATSQGIYRFHNAK